MRRVAAPHPKPAIPRLLCALRHCIVPIVQFKTRFDKHYLVSVYYRSVAEVAELADALV